MARPRKFDETQVLEKLMQVFWEKGYEATSLQDLVAASGLLKGSLYGAFGDKQTLYLAVLKYYDRTRIQVSIDMLTGAGSATQKITNLFNNVIDSMQKEIFAGGCLLCNASLEQAVITKPVKSEIKQALRRLAAALEAALQPHLKNEQRAVSMAACLLSGYLGTRVLAKAGAPAALISDTRDHCLQLLAGKCD